MAVTPLVVARETAGTARDIDRLRTLYGRAAEPWTTGGRFTVQDTHWIATSGSARGPNNALVHAASGTALDDVIHTLTADAVPAILWVAGPALGDVQRLADAGWVCIGQQPFMARPVDPSDRREVSAHPSVGSLATADVPEVRTILAETFGADSDGTEALLPDSMVQAPDQLIWTVRDAQGSLVGCAMASRNDDIVAVWNVAVRPSARRAGHAESLMRVLHGHLAHLDGVRVSLLSATAPGQSLYTRLGYETVEHWQMWSRPRWFLGRT